MTDSELYKELLLDLHQNPLHKGELKAATHSRDGFNPSCGDQLSIAWVENNQDEILAMKWQGTGCVISQVAADLALDHILEHNLSKQAILKLGQTDMERLLGLDKGINPGRRKCLLLGLGTIQSALK